MPKAQSRWAALAWLVGIAAGVYLLDQGSKAIVVATMTEGVVVPVLGPVLQLEFVRNPGAAFSFASGLTWILTLLAATVVGVIVWAAPRIRSLAWAVMFGVLLGGVLGNLTDRMLREPGVGIGHVVDFIAMPWLMPAIWNVADMAILTAMSIFLVLNIRGVRLNGSRLRDDAAAPTASAADTAVDAAGTESDG